VPLHWNFGSIVSPSIVLVPSPYFMGEGTFCGTRRYPRISLPNGMFVAWHGGNLQLFSRVRTLGMGGLFITSPEPSPVGTKLRLAFYVPGGSVHAEAIVRNIAPGEGMGVEFTKMDRQHRVLLERLLSRLLR
jgi:hypothetical protein